MDQRSEAQLAKVFPDLATLVRNAADILAAEGTFLLVVSGLRTAAEQNALFAQGRTAPGTIVTKARAGFSMHNPYGLAVELSSPIGQARPANSTGPSTHRNSSPWSPRSRAQGLIWGRRLEIFPPDNDHFQMPKLPATPNAAMIADYGSGDTDNLSAIWTKVASGVYVA